MDFDLSDDQRMIKDSVERLIADRYGFENRKALMRHPEGFSREMWARMAELGLLGVAFDEAHGGFGGGPVETMLIAEAFGRGLVVEPYFATVVLGAGLIRRAGSADQQADYLPRVAAGELLLAFAHHERHARNDLAYVATTASEQDGVWTITGDKGLVLHGDTADKIIVSARIAGETTDEDGIGLFVVDAVGLNRRGYATQDGQRAAEIAFDATQVEAVLSLDGFPAIAATVDAGIAFVCAEAVGGMAEMHSSTVDYMKTRKQFGRAIGEFQVLQHRAVDMFVNLEQARSMALYATMMADEPDAAERGRAISSAKVAIGRSGRAVGQEAVQLHGGIAMTMEYKVGHYFKRMTMIEKLFGDTEHHLAKVALAGGAL
jgi:pimeloyl-CoA dehydrogenase small subunit